ncbi:HD domain-containing protein [Streptomyces sp. NPDC004244]|uniref:HD domain-containing protein n=1 Tax=Streptomyces sp. NPDC101206 TaxID=3366128 RepID=UPI0037F4D7AB
MDMHRDRPPGRDTTADTTADPATEPATATAPATARLRDRWHATAASAGAPADRDPAPYADRLLAAWAEPQRRYHTTAHLADVLERIDVLAPHAADPAAVELAAWFHDAVYRPDRSENEERSAALAERALHELGVPGPRTAEVARLVRLTVTHDPAPGDTNGEVLCDADLAVLAGDPAAYAAYAAAVREEYGFVPEDSFRAGRAAVLRQLLDLPRLFRTPYGTAHWEARARRNLAAELADLADPVPPHGE